MAGIRRGSGNTYYNHTNQPRLKDVKQGDASTGTENNYCLFSFVLFLGRGAGANSSGMQSPFIVN